MPIVVNTNSAATTASFNLGRSNEALRKSLGRLSSGKQITSPVDDAGGLAVALKLASKTNRTSAVIQNVQNGISCLQVQDGVLSAVGKSLSRMASPWSTPISPDRTCSYKRAHPWPHRRTNLPT